MNRYFTYALLVISIFAMTCCTQKHAPGNRKVKLNHPPPGTNHLLENIFIDQTEVSNMTWREYMYWTKKVYGAESVKYKSTLPDTLVWKSCFSDFKLKTNQDWTDIESLVYLYLRHPQYSYFPVVGISFEQANNFCSWRTNRVNEVLYVNKHKNVTFPIDSSIVIPKRVLFRLPSEEEWEFAASSGFDSSKYMNNNVRKIYYNTLETSSVRIVTNNNERFTPMLESSLMPDRYNRYHLHGNVAEMINSKGIAKGGSFIHSLNDSHYSKQTLYSEPTYWLGFRCVCEILQDHK
ncbi:MAG: SUMF1/EgtB/PvdO family nonheme iron enzyme [Bacteroidota bacterium]|nr:SUMF1/EgtB/PvdO family nonheme iron enzyme [Bacteroidota bacterium]